MQIFDISVLYGKYTTNWKQIANSTSKLQWLWRNDKALDKKANL